MSGGVSVAGRRRVRERGGDSGEWGILLVVKGRGRERGRGEEVDDSYASLS